MFSLLENSFKFNPSLSIVSSCPITQNPWRRRPISTVEASPLPTVQSKQNILQRRFISTKEVVHERILPFRSLATGNEPIARSIWMLQRGDVTFAKPSGRSPGPRISLAGRNKLTTTASRLVRAERRENGLQRRDELISMSEKLVK
jgi:hypothetical protein